MSNVVASLVLESQLGSPACVATAEDMLPHSDCSNNGTSLSDTASPRSDDKSSVSGDHLEDTSSLPSSLPTELDLAAQQVEENVTSDSEEAPGSHLLQVKGLPRFYRLGVS